MADNEKLFTLLEAAGKTHMSRSWWRAKVKEGRVRYVRFGRKIFIPESTINRLLADGTVEPR